MAQISVIQFRWREISMLLDLSVRQQSYIEDCEVCCNPIEIRYTFEDDFVVDFSAGKME